MPAAGLRPNDDTVKVVNKSEHIFAKMRTSSLRRMVKAGDEESARALMDKLKDNGKANVVTSTSCWRPVRAAPRCGV